VHFIHLPHYIHTNPLSLNYGGSTSIEFLENYRWSSFPDYIGKKNFPSVTKRGFLLNVFGSEKKYKALTEELLKEYDEERNSEKIKDIIME
jgi:putative transposase